MEIELNIKSTDKKEIVELFQALANTGTNIELKPVQEPVQEHVQQQKTKSATEKVKFPKIHGKTRETILQMLEYYEGGTINELIKHTDIKRNTLANELSMLVKKRLAETSTTRPKTYYVRGKNMEIKELLKNAPKRK